MRLLSAERWQLRLEEQGLRQASGGKGTFRCHCESPQQGAIKSVHKRNLRESRGGSESLYFKMIKMPFERDLRGQNFKRQAVEMSCSHVDGRDC